MGKTLTARYDAAENVLRLAEPLEGVKDHDEVKVTVEEKPPLDPERPWLAFSGIMSGEQGEEFARVIEEMFPIEKE